MSRTSTSLILGTLSALLLITIISVVSGNSFVGASSAFTGAFSQALNGTESNLGLEGAEAFGIDPALGAIGMFVAIGGIAGVVGITVLGTGLANWAVRIITMITTYGAIWGVLSALAYGLIISIETFGGMMYILLTLFYVIGVVLQISGD